MSLEIILKDASNLSSTKAIVLRPNTNKNITHWLFLWVQFIIKNSLCTVSSKKKINPPQNQEFWVNGRQENIFRLIFGYLWRWCTTESYLHINKAQYFHYSKSQIHKVTSKISHRHTKSDTNCFDCQQPTSPLSRTHLPCYRQTAPFSISTVRLTIIGPHLLFTVNWSWARCVTNTKPEPSHGVYNGAGIGNALPFQWSGEGLGGILTKSHACRSEQDAERGTGVGSWVLRCIWISAAPWPCSLLHKPVSSSLPCYLKGPK